MPVSGFLLRRIRRDPLLQLQSFRVSSTQEMGKRSKQMVIWRWKMSAVYWVWYQFDSCQFLNYLMVDRVVWGHALSCCKRTLFRFTNDGYLSLKISRIVPVVENEDPHHLHVHLEQISWESQFQNYARHTTLGLLWGPSDFLANTLAGLRGPIHFFIASGLRYYTHFLNHRWQFSW